MSQVNDERDVIPPLDAEEPDTEAKPPESGPTRRTVVKMTVAAAAGLAATGYVKPTMVSLGVPSALAWVSGASSPSPSPSPSPSADHRNNGDAPWR